MIYVEIKSNNLTLARIEIKNLEVHPDGRADYRIKYVVERGSAVGLHNRTVHQFPRKKYNVLALVRQALATLEEKELTLERDFDPDEAPVSADMGGGFGPTLRQIQARISKLHRD